MAVGALAAVAALGLAAAPGCAKRKQSAPAGGQASQTAPAGGVGEAAGAAAKVAIGDLDGDGKPEIVFGDPPGDLRVVDRSGRLMAKTDKASGIEVLVVGDADGDGRNEILVGWGKSREHQDATAKVTIYRLKGDQLVEELVVAPRTSRQDTAAIVPSAAGLVVAYFENKYQVRSARATLSGGAWTLADIASLRMATSYAVGDVDGDGQPDLVVGRVYGEDQDAPGDAFVLRPDGTRTPIPTTRGVRGLALADLDGDGQNEIYLGDGWDKNYGQVARALLTRSRWVAGGDAPGGGAFHSDLIEDSNGQFTLWKILVVDLDADGRPEIVTQGTKYARAYRLTGGAWQAVTLGGTNPRDLAAGDLDGQPGDEVLVVGERTEISSGRGAQWAPVPAPKP